MTALSNPALTAVPSVTYASPNATGALDTRRAPNASGTADIAVTVSDAIGRKLDTPGDNGTVTRTFAVTVNRE